MKQTLPLHGAEAWHCAEASWASADWARAAAAGSKGTQETQWRYFSLSPENTQGKGSDIRPGCVVRLCEEVK